MRRLMLLRHAKAVPQGSMADEERPLAVRGRRDTPLIGKFAVSRGLVPDLALVSSSVRTRVTWELFAAAFASPAAFPPLRNWAKVVMFNPPAAFCALW